MRLLLTILLLTLSGLTAQAQVVGRVDPASCPRLIPEVRTRVKETAIECTVFALGAQRDKYDRPCQSHKRWRQTEIDLIKQCAHPEPDFTYERIKLRLNATLKVCKIKQRFYAQTGQEITAAIWEAKAAIIAEMLAAIEEDRRR